LLQCVAVCQKRNEPVRSFVLQCVARCCSVLQHVRSARRLFNILRCSVLKCAAVCCSVLQCVAVGCSNLSRHLQNQNHQRQKCLKPVGYFVLQCVAVCCSVLQCVAVCCSVLQCVAVCCSNSTSSSRTTYIDSSARSLFDVSNELSLKIFFVCVLHCGASVLHCVFLSLILQCSSANSQCAGRMFGICVCARACMFVCVYVRMCMCMCVCVCVCVYVCARASVCVSPTKRPEDSYGVAIISRLLKIIGLFCKRAL